MKQIRRLTSALPPGTMSVIVGIVVLGAASYVHLAVAGHTLGDTGMAHVSVLWTIVMSVGVGLFMPVEQELTRIVAGRAVQGAGVAPAFRRMLVAVVLMLGTVLVLVAALAPVLADRLFDGDMSIVLALAGAFVGLAACYVTRGILAGLGLFAAYSTQLAVDGGLRIVLALALGVFGVDSPLMFGLILMVAPLAATLLTLRPVLRALTPGTDLPWREVAPGLGLLVCSTLLSQLVVNIAVISTKLLAPDETALVSALLSAIVLARVPLFVFASLQTSLLKGLSDAAARGEFREFKRMLAKACAAVFALGILGGIPATIGGPWIIGVAFASPDVLTSADFAWLSLGTLGFMLAMVLGQAAMTLGRHRLQLLAWVLGTAVLIGVTLLPGGIALRVELAYTVGSLTVVGVIAAALWPQLRGSAGVGSAPVRAEDAATVGAVN
jgi:O-antigen/teichoic acid export membrane protein